MGFRHALKEMVDEILVSADQAYMESESGSDVETHARDALHRARAAMEAITGYTGEACNKRHPDGFVCTRPEDHDGLHVAGFHDVSTVPVVVWGVANGEQVEYQASDRRYWPLFSALVYHADRN